MKRTEYSTQHIGNNSYHHLHFLRNQAYFGGGGCQFWPGLRSQESQLFYFSFEGNTLLFTHIDLLVVPQIYYICSQLCFSSHAVSLPYAAILSLIGLANFYSLISSRLKCHLSYMAFPGSLRFLLISHCT